MDMVNVPKKYNRHVLKAISILSGKKSSSGFESIENIMFQVEKQMRGLKKDDLQCFVQKSLYNLTCLGLLMCSGGANYALRQNIISNSRINICGDCAGRPKKRKNESDENCAIDRLRLKKPHLKKKFGKPMPIERKLNRRPLINKCVGSECHLTVLKYLNEYRQTDNDMEVKLEIGVKESIEQINEPQAEPVNQDIVIAEPVWDFADPWLISPHTE